MQTTSTTTLTAQSIFNEVVHGLALQGGPAMAADGDGCVYRAMNGRKCAAGLLILDEEYLPEFEHNSIDHIGDRLPRLAAFNENEEALLRKLQCAHDAGKVDREGDPDAKWVEPWVRPEFGIQGIAARLEGVAAQFSLDTSALYAAFPAESTAA